MKKIYVRIEGIHCNHCEEKITKALLKNKKIKKVEIKNNIAYIQYQGKINNNEVIDIITKLDYVTTSEYISDNLKDLDNKIELKESIIITTIILTIWIAINQILGFNIFSVIPTIDSAVTYGMLFMTGILTSIHCISMCGVINLIAVVDNRKNKSMKKSLLYNLGRLTSYTIIGGVIGTIGSVISINDTIYGIITVIASIIMLLMSLSMLGIIKFKLKFINSMKIKKNLTVHL